jgi:hypothetical protein
MPLVCIPPPLDCAAQCVNDRQIATHIANPKPIRSDVKRICTIETDSGRFRCTRKFNANLIKTPLRNHDSWLSKQFLPDSIFMYLRLYNPS